MRRLACLACLACLAALSEAAGAAAAAGSPPGVRFSFDASRATRSAAGAAAAAASPPGVRFSFDTSRATPGVVDDQALAGAAAGLGSVVLMAAQVPPQRGAVGTVPVVCDPYTNASVPVDIGGIGRGEIRVIVYTHTEADVWTCRTQIAHVQMCATEVSRFVVPLVAYMNVCSERSGSMLNADSTPALRYRAYMHELIHILGFTEESMSTSGILHPVPGAPGLQAVESPSVSSTVRELYGGCATGAVNASYIVNSHWDPLFLGQRELMTSQVGDDSILSPTTLALLADLGPCEINVTAALLELPPGLLGWASERDGYGCRVAIIRCGEYPAFAPASLCPLLGVGVGQWVAAPHPVEMGPRAVPSITPERPETPPVAAGSHGVRAQGGWGRALAGAAVGVAMLGWALS